MLVTMQYLPHHISQFLHADRDFNFINSLQDATYGIASVHYPFKYRHKVLITDVEEKDLGLSSIVHNMYGSNKGYMHLINDYDIDYIKLIGINYCCLYELDMYLYHPLTCNGCIAGFDY